MHIDSGQRVSSPAVMVMVSAVGARGTDTDIARFAVTVIVETTGTQNVALDVFPVRVQQGRYVSW